jgi:hypothetical protein
MITIAILENSIVTGITEAANLGVLNGLTVVDITNIPDVVVGSVYVSGTTFTAPTSVTAPNLFGLVYRKYETYLEFINYMASVHTLAFSAMIREKNRDSLLGSQLEVYFEVLKVNDGIDFNNTVSRTTFALLKLPIAGVSGNETILTAAQYNAIIAHEAEVAAP